MKNLKNKLSSKPVKFIAKTAEAALGVALGTFLFGNVVGLTLVRDSLDSEKAEKIINTYEKQNILIKIPMYGAYLASENYLELVKKIENSKTSYPEKQDK